MMDRFKWWPVVLKSLVAGGLLAPVLGALPLLVMVLPSSTGPGEAGFLPTVILLGAIYTTAAYGILCASVLAWLSLQWATKAVPATQILRRDVLLSAVLGAVWGCFMAARYVGTHATDVFEVLRRGNALWLFDGLVAGAVFGWAMFRLLRKHLGILTAPRRKQ